MMLIKVPAPIDVKIYGTDRTKPMTLANFIEDLLSVDKRAGANLKSIRSAQEIIEAFKSPDDGVVKIHANDYELLKNIVESPGEGYIPFVAFQIMPFIDAIMSAQKDT
jgi:hypothetical protein